MARAAAVLAAGAWTELFASNYSYLPSCSVSPSCWRQPVLVAPSPTNLIVFIEGRCNAWCSGTADGSPSSIHARASFDGGASWGAPVTLPSPGGVDFLGGVHDPARGATHLFVQLGSATLHTTSTDGGRSFAPLAPLVVPPPAGFTYAQPSVSRGLALDGRLCGDGSCAGLAGRLLVPFICHAPAPTPTHAAGAAAAAARAPAPRKGDVACPGCYSCLLRSDDGVAWSVGAVSPQDGSREAALVQLVSGARGGSPGGGALLAVERNMGAAPGHKRYALSLDSGDSVADAGDVPGLPDGVTANWTGVVSGATAVRGDARGPRLVVTAPLSTTARQDFGAFVSTDEGATWGAGTLLRAGPAGYSDVLALNATHVAVVFECGDDDAAFDFAKRVVFGVVDAYAL